MKIAKGTKKIVVKNFIIPAVGCFVAKYPEFLPSWLLIQGFFGSLFDLQQEKVNEFIKYLKNNIDIFTKEVISTKDFQEGFVITFENYLKQRNEKKRKIIHNIFLEFAQSKDKINFELERMYDILNKISLFELHILKKFNNNKKITIDYEDRNNEELDYNDIKYLQSLGLLYVDVSRDLDVQITTEKRITQDEKYSGEDYNSEADPVIEEKETFYLSCFGEDFIKFIEK